MDALKRRIRMFGKAPLCSLKSETAPHIGGFCFPLCWRCTGIVMGAVLAAVFYAVARPHLPPLAYALSPALMLPLIVDGVRVHHCKRRGHNALRLLTGLLFGVAAVSVCRLF